MYNIVGITLFCLKTKITFDYWYFETQTAENGEIKINGKHKHGIFLIYAIHNLPAIKFRSTKPLNFPCCL